MLVVPRHALPLARLRSMSSGTEASAVVAPPVPGFHTRPASVADVVDHTVARGSLHLFRLEMPGPPMPGNAAVFAAAWTGDGRLASGREHARTRP